MTRDRDIERLLDHWFADGPVNVPDRVFDGAVERIHRQRQRPAWRLLGREYHVNSYARALAAVAAVIVLAVVGWNLLPGRSANVAAPAPSAVPTPAPSATATPSPVPTAPWDTGGVKCGQAGCGGPLPAGTYSSQALQPAVTYTLSSPWVNVRDWPDFFQLYPDTPANRTLAAAGKYAPYVLVLPALKVSPSGACVDVATDEVPMDSAAVAQWLSSEADVTVTDPAPVTVGGLEGLQVDVAPGDRWTRCLPGTPLGETNTAADRYRFIVLDQPDGTTLMIRLWAPAGEFDAFVADAMPVVESFGFDLSTLPSPTAS